MASWSFMLDDLMDMFYGIHRDYNSIHGSHMSELSAMGDYNNARKQNLFGSVKGAFDQRSKVQSKAPAHMMPGFMEWLGKNQPDTHRFLYGDRVPEHTQPHRAPSPPKRQDADTRSRAERRGKQTPPNVPDGFPENWRELAENAKPRKL